MLLAPPVNADCGDQDQLVADVQAVDLDGQQIERRQVGSQPLPQLGAQQGDELARHRRLRGAVARERPDIAARPPHRAAELAGREVISIWFIAHWPSHSSSCAAAQLGSTSSCWPSRLRTRGRSTPTRPP
jgi:hypothetical protein